ncbi:tRNA (adenosine(37)-N6)-threonylcarbamoyltransferase complex transferase subunit TsaD [bacterium]|nr:MAG: tRNA (adenosine(37)-N6)-threonylcarbamoyltransferase complex transferase subunit TsaD [bacterium]
MKVLAIETSCDETGVAVYDGKNLRDVLYSQRVHTRFGGVVPEIASRDHMRKLLPLLHELLSPDELPAIDVIAATRGPGLIGSLLVGLGFAKSLAYALKKPFIGVNHLEAHIFSLKIEHKMETPFVCLLVSGGHTILMVVEEWGRYKILGETLDDAAGEAFDKVSKLIGLGYPGGSAIEKAAEEGNPRAFPFPTPDPPGYDMSYSGLKTAVLYTYQKLSPQEKIDKIPDLAASFQHHAVEQLILKLKKAVKETGINRIGLTGGVAANKLLREWAHELGEVFYPSRRYCTDNAAMVALTAYFYAQRGEFHELDVRADPSLSL